MDPNAWERLFGFRQAFDEPAVVLIVGLLILLLAVSPPIILVLDRLVGLNPAVRGDLSRRYVSWLVTVPIIVLSVLLNSLARFWDV
jgi:phosphatidate cytidylyltransferase